MPHSPAPPRHFSAYALFPWVMALALACTWAWYIATYVPRGWLGGMDGYFYALMVKTYLNHWHFAAIDAAYPVNYPPYFFYLQGLVGKLLHTQRLDVLMAGGIVFAQLFFTVGSWALLRSAYGRAFSCWVLLVAWMLFMYAWGFEHIWQKAHEVTALIALPAALVYAAWLDGAPVKRLPRILAGVALGYAFGAYTPFALVPMACVAGLIGVGMLRARDWPARWQVLDWAFLDGAFAAALPFLTAALYTVWDWGGLGNVPAAFEYNVHFQFLNSGSPVGWTALALGVLGADRLRGARFSYALLYGVLVIAVGVLMFGYYAEAYEWGVLQTSPYKFILGLPFAAAVILGKLLEGWQNSRWLAAQSLFARHGSWRVLAAAGGPLVIVFSLLSKMFCGDFYVESQTLFPNRGALLQPVADFIGSARRARPVERYLANDEASFLNVQVPGELNNELLFSESYASLFENLGARTQALKDAANSPEAFYALLRRRQIDALFLRPDAGGASYTIHHMLTFGTDVRHPDGIVLPRVTLQKLVADGRLAQSRAGDYDCYLINPPRIAAQ